MADNHRYDVIVIGGGQNGLTAAALLAKAGRRVLLLEKRAVLGGMCAAEEFAPGYRSPGILHDSFGLRRRVVDKLDLSRFGLELIPEQPPVFVPQREGRGLLLDPDPERAAGEIASFSSRDADRYAEYRSFILRARKFFKSLFDEPPPRPFEGRRGDAWRRIKYAAALRRMGKKDMVEVLRAGPMSVADWLGEWFESDVLKAALAAPALYGTWMGPRSPTSAANLLLYECSDGTAFGGGGAVLIAALERAARANGVEIRAKSNVERIRVTRGRTEGVVIEGGERYDAPLVVSSCDPKRTLLKLLPGGALGEKAVRRIRAFRTRGTAAKVHIALSKPLRIASRESETFSRIRIGEHLDELERAFDAVKYRRYSDKPVLDVFVPTVADPDLAPEGHCILSVLVQFVPYQYEEGWDASARQDLARRVVSRLSPHLEGLEPAIAGMEVLTPTDLEARFGITGGHIHHGEHALDQLIVRPTPECARYRTPVEGLYLCGSGSHPGGGITCAPGELAARVILAET